MMMMEDFEKTFCSEWKHHKKESVALREVFLTGNTKEIEKIQRDYKIETTKSLVGANMTMLELERTGGAVSSIAAHEGKGVATAKASIEGNAAHLGEDTAREKEATQGEVARPAVEGLQADKSSGQDPTKSV
jgi:HD superfamily phosphodiesterase